MLEKHKKVFIYKVNIRNRMQIGSSVEEPQRHSQTHTAIKHLNSFSVGAKAYYTETNFTSVGL